LGKALEGRAIKDLKKLHQSRSKMKADNLFVFQLQLMTLELETGFTKSSIRRLQSRFKSLDKGSKGYLEKRDLVSIPEVCLADILC